MAAAITLLTNGFDTSVPTSSASVSASAGDVIEVDALVKCFTPGSPGTFNITATGLTFSSVADNLHGPTGQSGRLARFRALVPGGGFSGVINFDISGGASTKSILWAIKKVTGVDTGGTNASNAYRQTVHNEVDGSGVPNNITLTLAALASGGTKLVSACFTNDNNDAITPETGYTELSDQGSTTGEDRLETQYKAPGTTTITAAAGAFADQAGIASEYVDAGGGTPDPAVSSVTPSSFADAATGVVIAGTTFEASQGTGKVELSNNATYGSGTVVQQTVTAWSDTSITITIVKGALSPGGLYLWVTNNAGQHNGTGFSVTLTGSGPVIAAVLADDL